MNALLFISQLFYTKLINSIHLLSGYSSQGFSDSNSKSINFYSIPSEINDFLSFSIELDANSMSKHSKLSQNIFHFPDLLLTTLQFSSQA